MEKIPNLIIDNFLTSEELESVWRELEYLRQGGFFLPPENTGSAVDPDTKEALKQNSGIFYAEMFHTSTRPKTAVERVFQTFFQGKSRVSILDQYRDLSVATGSVQNSRFGSTLVSYYENGEHYKSHQDDGYTTMLLWLYKEPKRFTGGNLIFTQTQEEIEAKNNRLLIFPSWCFHEVPEVVLPKEYQNQGFGRYCLTYFML